MELEESIKRCKKFIRAFKKDNTKSVIGFDVQAIETVLEEFENKDKLIYKLESGKDFTSNQAKFIEKNFIPKKKIEDKMEKYRLNIKAYDDEAWYKYKGFQELLEDK